MPYIKDELEKIYLYSLLAKIKERAKFASRIFVFASVHRLSDKHIDELRNMGLTVAYTQAYSNFFWKNEEGWEISW